MLHEKFIDTLVKKYNDYYKEHGHKENAVPFIVWLQVRDNTNNISSKKGVKHYAI